MNPERGQIWWADLRSEYDFSSLGKGVRGKYFNRATSGGNLVLIDPELSKAFPTEKAVSDALRPLVNVASATHGTPEQRANWQLLGDGKGIHWPDVDEHLSIAGILRGVPAPPERR